MIPILAKVVFYFSACECLTYSIMNVDLVKVVVIANKVAIALSFMCVDETVCFHALSNLATALRCFFYIKSGKASLQVCGVEFVTTCTSVQYCI